MNTRRSLSLWMLISIFVLVLSACQPANAPTSIPTLSPTQPPVATPLPTSEAVIQPTQPASPEGGISLDLSGVAQEKTVETIPAVTAGENAPSWEVMPQYQRLTLQGYAITDHLLKPQIFIFPMVDLASSNAAAGQIAADLQSLLQSQQPADKMPFLPLFNAQQDMHAQVQYLDFKNGKGVRFLTQFDQAPLPVNDYELFYTFQGLTNDGKYYIAAVLPVTHPDLPATQQVSPELISQMSDFPAYLAKTTSWLEQQPASSFTPDLTKLDTMLASLEVK